MKQISRDERNMPFPGLQEALIRALCGGEGLDAMAGLLAERVGGCVAVIDANGATLAAAIPGTLGEAQKEVLRHYLSALKHRDRHSFAKSVKADDRADSFTYEGHSLYRNIFSLEAAGEGAGTLFVISPSPLTDDAPETVRQAAGLFCVRLAQDKKIAEIELRLKGDFVEDLVLSRFSDPDSILNRARALEYDILAAHRVLVAAIDNIEQLLHRFAGDREAAARFKNELLRSVQNRLDKTHRGMAIFSKDDIILLVQPNDQGGDIGEFRELAGRIIEDAALQFKAKLYIGIGRACAGLPDFAQSFLEAGKALEIGEYMITEGQIRSFEQFKVHALFLSTLKPADLYNYAREQLEPLLAYDERHHTDFLKTLQEFLYLRNNVEGTAKALNMSVSGLKYRLQKIEKILGHDLKDYKVCFDLQLALVIMQLFGEYRIKEKSD